ncbi:hypothetical protein ECED1_3322 [Escherichia coli ED1a]|uniref:Uncharacterized protein n=1 Tax=Escherichia coli O81 (strain ED1a) TaxID=585397 RepID=B7MZG2_ECO81|nr:hypothetical protein ECED1_3322 [Escherichia coli ED1a]
MRFVSAVDSYLNRCMFPDSKSIGHCGTNHPAASMLKINSTLPALHRLMDESLHAL